MGDQLIQQAESAVREGVRNVAAERLHGEVNVVHWSTIRDAIEQSLSQARDEVEQLVPAPAPQIDLTNLDEAARLRIEELERALDYLDLAEDFDLEGFETECDELKDKVDALDAPYRSKADEGLPLGLRIDDMLLRASKDKDEMSEHFTRVLEGRAGIATVVRMVKLSKDGGRLWGELRLLGHFADMLGKVLA